MVGNSGSGGISALPLKVIANGDLVYTSPDGTTQVLAHADPFPVKKSYSFRSATAATGVTYTAGFYHLEAADLNLSDATPLTGTAGAANVPYAAHAILVAKEAGTASGGATGVGVITVTGTSINDAGVRDDSASEVIVADTTAMTANQYYETALKWIGQVTYTLSQDGDRTTYAADFNVGFAKYDDWGNHDFTIINFELVGVAGNNDSSFDIALIKHSADNWVYHASAFVAPVDNDVTRMSTTHSTENDLDTGEPFAFKSTGLSVVVAGSAQRPTLTEPNGYVVQVTTGANNAVRFMTSHVGVKLG